MEKSRLRICINTSKKFKYILLHEYPFQSKKQTFNLHFSQTFLQNDSLFYIVKRNNQNKVESEIALKNVWVVSANKYHSVILLRDIVNIR